MKRICLVAALLIGLGGCAGFDPAALQAAHQVKLQRYAQCDAVIAGHGTNVSLLECYMAAEKENAESIHLLNMWLYTAYADQVRLIALDTDAGRISEAERNSRLIAAGQAYTASITQDYANRQADRADLATGLAAFGAGVAQGAAKRPVYCNTNMDGNTAQTTCR